MASDARYIVGIDLGTTHTVVAYGPSDGSSPPRIFEIDQLVAPGEVEARPLLHSLRYHPSADELPESARALPWGETPPFPGSEGAYVVGELARTLGAKVPGRLVTSAKSWLSHPSVDRTAAILPWGAPDDVPKVSAVVASASFLAHVRAAWDHHHPEAPLDAQDVVLTIPASFDEGARALTLEAARLAGLGKLRLVEEPQAAFYDWLTRESAATVDAAGAVGDTRLALVVDVGGGTTDLTLIRCERREEGPRLTRVAVGDHLMLGGDNMDLALAHAAEERMGVAGKLGAGRFTQLLVQCRHAKESLLGDPAPEQTTVTVLGSGSKLVGGALAATLARSDVEARILDGFLPVVDVDASPAKRAGAIVEFGLPYVSDAAVTRHVAAFLTRHQDLAREALGDRGSAAGVAIPDAVLLNGGVFRGAKLAARMVSQLEAWRGGPLRVLDNAEPELAVARGAVAFGLARRGLGARIGGGSARSYFLLLPGASEDAPRRCVCVLPRGAEEGEEVALAGRSFSLRLGAPVRFQLASSTGEAAYVRPGDLVEVDEELFRDLPPLAAVLEREGGEGTSNEVKVTLASSLTEIGTLELACLAEDPPARRWKLELMLRGGGEGALAPARVGQLHPRAREARQRIDGVYGKSEAKEGKPQKTLRADLEKVLGPRAHWTPPLLRDLWGALFAGARRRRRSDDHERVWFNLVGYCLRPGFGFPLDDWRTRQLFGQVFEQGVQFAPEAQNWSEWWTLWRRVAGGLDAPSQQKVLASIEWYLQPPSPRPRPRPPGPKALGHDDMVRLAASLERIASVDKARVGDALLERLRAHGENPATWWAVGRIGARVPFSGSAHHVVPRAKVEAWLGHVLALDWSKVEPAAFAAAQMARRSGDRTRDLDEGLRAEVIRRLQAAGAPEAWSRMVAEVAELEASEETRVFGESLPQGLRLLG